MATDLKFFLTFYESKKDDIQNTLKRDNVLFSNIKRGVLTSFWRRSAVVECPVKDSQMYEIFKFSVS